jgi:hypothetical protein
MALLAPIAPRAVLSGLALAAAVCLALLGPGPMGPALSMGADTPLSVAADANVRSIAVGDTFRLNVRAEWTEGTEVKSVAVPDKIGNFVVKDIGEGPVQSSGGVSTRNTSLLLTSFETGQQTIPPISVAYVRPDGSGGNAQTPPVQIEVASVLPKGAADIRDIKRPITVPKRWKDILLSYALVIGLALAAGLSVLVSLKRREEIDAFFGRLWRRVSGPVRRLVLWLMALLGLRRRGLEFDIQVDEPGLPPGAAALKELDRIAVLALIDRNLVKEHYTLVSETLRRYLERQSGVLAMESPTALTLRALRALDLPLEAYAAIEEVLGECDLVKFAKHTPARGAAASLIDRSRTIVRLTADLALVPEAWLLAGQYPGATVKPGSQAGGPPDQGVTREPAPAADARRASDGGAQA